VFNNKENGAYEMAESIKHRQLIEYAGKALDEALKD